MNAIFRREFRSYFNNVMGFIFIAALILFCGIFVLLYNLVGLTPYISTAFSDLTLIMAILTPIITMRVFAEERKNGAYRLLCSLPLRSSQIVMGKYLALVSIFAIPVAFMAFLPLMLSAFGEINFLSSYGSLLCFFLFGAALMALCVFIASLSDNLVICAVISYVTVFLLYFANALIVRIPDSSPFKNIAMLFGIFRHFEPFVYGIFDITSVLYYVSIIAVFLFLTVRSFEKRRKA